MWGRCFEMHQLDSECSNGRKKEFPCTDAKTLRQLHKHVATHFAFGWYYDKHYFTIFGAW